MTNLNVILDGRVFTNNHQLGIQRYFREVLNRAYHHTDICATLVLDSMAEVELPLTSKLIYRHERFILPKNAIRKRLLAKIKKKFAPTPFPGGDVFHSTYFSPAPVAIPTVQTVYDMLPETLPYYFGGDNNPEIEMKRQSILSAKQIIAISETTKNQVQAIYPEVAGRIHVIHLGADHLLTNLNQRTSTSGNSDYVLFVGERMRYKNFVTVAAAMESHNWPKQIKLVVVGRPFSKGEELYLNHRGLRSRIEHLGRVSDSQLADLYSDALGFIFASVGEGFGFPMLEAQSLATPVVAADCDCFREVGGEAFIPFRALDPDDLAGAVSRLLNRIERNQLIEKGLINVSRFSWEKCAEQTITVWKNCCLS
jgi:mannosyltransferase